MRAFDYHGPMRTDHILSAQYFIYFGVMGVFLPYFNLYCYHLGFSGSQIGTISAVRSLVMIALPMVWAALADRFNIRRAIFITCSFCSAAAWSLFLVVRTYRPMLLATIVYALFYAPLIAFLEAFAMDVLAERKKQYGRMRAWGSVAFITVVLVLGRVLENHSLTLVVWIILGGSVLQAVVACRLPPMAPRSRDNFLRAARLLISPRVMVFLTCGFLMLVSHGAYYAFFSIHLAALGFGKSFIGLCWAVASTAEIWAMFNSRRIFQHFTFPKVMLFSFAIAVLRWTGLLWARGFWLLLALQVLHAFTYGTFHMASILYMDQLAPAAAKTLGQAVNNAMTYGFGLMVGFFVSGLLYERFGSGLMFAFSIAVALAGGLIFAFFLLLPGETRAVPTK